MKIAHVVSLITPDGAFGGPARVAVDIARQQLSMGNEVRVFAGTYGWGEAPREISGVPVSLFPASRVVPGTGFAGYWARGLGHAIRGFVDERSMGHVHLARDLISTAGARALMRAGVPYFVQTHGMLDRPSVLMARAADQAMILRILAQSHHVFALTDDEVQFIRPHLGNAGAMSLLWNGVHADDFAAPERVTRDSVVFLARLHPRKGAEEFAHAALRISSRFPHLRFLIAGPDEGAGDSVRRAIARHGTRQVRYIGAVRPEDVPDLLGRALLFVSPAEREPFGLSFLEAMASSVPVVLKESAALAEVISAAGAGVSYSGDERALADLMGRLLSDPRGLGEMSVNAVKLVRDRFTMERVVERLMGYVPPSSTPPRR